MTVHYYLPMRFTHQGARWTPEYRDVSGVTWGTPAERAALDADFDGVQAWAKANDRPILLGEFGAYDKTGTPEAMRAAYIESVAREAERHGFGWAYWQFEGDFVVWDMKNQRWVEPIRKALLP